MSLKVVTIDRQKEAERMAIELTNRVIDAIYSNAIGVGRVAGLPIEDIPRLLLSASCRTLEKMIEAYETRLRQAGEGAAGEPTHPDVFGPDERAARQRQIHAATEDLLQASAEMHASVKQIQESISGKVTPQ